MFLVWMTIFEFDIVNIRALYFNNEQTLPMEANMLKRMYKIYYKN